MTKYRADIDGLRAVAVGAVVLFHLGFEGVPGGYVGVDVFFVISGYLITSIIKKELDAGRFSLSRFYERRFRRILPTLMAVCSVTAVVGLMLLSPELLTDFGQSLAAAALFSSNVLFYLESGYFNGPAELKPLLHTWSLAVEEQYYLLFPLMMMLVARYGRRYGLWIAVAAIGSLALCEWALFRGSESAAFYLIPARAWELLVGAGIAVISFRARSGLFHEVTAAFGLVAIGVSALFYTSETRFPGTSALLPTFGAAAIIASGAQRRTLVAELLSMRPLVFIGLISYSLYLWHWPVVVFTKYYVIKEPTLGLKLAMLLLMLGLSYLSWRWVETPFRGAGLVTTRRQVFALSGLSTALVVLAGVAIGSQIVAEQRYPVIVSKTFVTNDAEWKHWRSCEQGLIDLESPFDYCGIGAESGAPTFVVWGDSHATALASGLDLAATRAGVSGWFASRSACAPLLDVNRVGDGECASFNHKVLADILGNPELKLVVLAARWPFVATGERYKEESGPLAQLHDAAVHETERERDGNGALMERGLRRTLKSLQDGGRRIVILGPVPEVGYEVPAALFVASITGRDASRLIAPSRIEYLARTEGVRGMFQQFSDQRSVKWIDLAGRLCGVSVQTAALYSRGSSAISLRASTETERCDGNRNGQGSLRPTQRVGLARVD